MFEQFVPWVTWFRGVIKKCPCIVVLMIYLILDLHIRNIKELMYGIDYKEKFILETENSLCCLWQNIMK